MRKRVLFYLLTALTVMGMVLAACASPQTPPSPTQPPQTAEQGGQPQPQPTQPPAKPAEKVTIRLTTWAGAGEAAELQQILDRINAENTDFQIVHEPAPDDYYTKVQTTLAGGTAADLIWLSQEWIANLASKGALLDITDYLKNDSSPAAQLDDYFADVLKTAAYEGRYYGLPWIAQPVVLYYNKALFDAAGLAYPDESWTWDIFKEAAKTLTKDLDGDGRNDQWGFALNGWPPPQMFIWQAGGEVVSNDLKSSPVDSPEAIKALEFYQEMIYSDVYAPPQATIQEQGFGEMFKAGKIAMFMGGAADDLDRVEGLDVGVAPVPAGAAGRQTFAWTASTVVAAQTKNPELAYKALVQLTEGIHGWKIVPPRKSLATAEAISRIEPRKAKSAEAIAQAVPFMRSFNILPRHQEWDSIFWGELMDPLMQKKSAPAELAAEIRQKLEAVLP